MNQSTQLVHKNELGAVLLTLMDKEKQIVREIEKILPYIETEKMKQDLERKLSRALENIKVLEAGYVPVDGGWFWNVETKSHWARSDVKGILQTMPDDIKEAWNRAKELGIFKEFAVSGARRGDPVLVGNAGNKHYLIGAWVNFEGGYSAGFRMMPKREED